MKFIVSAPGKVILFGEHAVVYGYPAISAAIGLRCHFEVTTEQSSSDSNLILINFQDLEHESVRLPKSICYTNPSQLTPNLIDYSWSVVSNILDKPNDPLSKQTALNRSLCVLIYLIFRMITLNPESQYSTSSPILDSQNSIRLNIYSDIPKSAGLGSSAAFSVCASTVLLYLFGHLVPETDWIPTMKQLNLIQQLAHEAESIIHGKSSGLDTSTSAQGGILVYQNPTKPCITKLALPTNQSDLLQMNVLLVDSHVTRSTQTIVRKLSNAYVTNPEIDTIFKEIGTLVETAINLFSQPNANGSCSPNKLGLLINKNQELLNKLHVSCPQLDDVISCLNEHAIPAKLTGAGCGGFVIGFPLSGDKQKHLTQVLDYLHDEKRLWAQIVQISDHGVRFKLCSL